MGIEDGALTRPAASVRRDIAELAVDVFVAVQRATVALTATEAYAFTNPSRAAALALAEARREVKALAEAHALIKALITYQDGLVRLMPDAFQPEEHAAAPEAVPAAPTGKPSLALINGGRA